MKSFEHEATVKSFFPDICGAVIVFIYSLFSTKFSIEVFLDALKVFLGILIFFQFGLALITDHLCYHKISTRIKSFYTSKSTVTERTHLFDEIIQYPFFTALMTFFYFFVGSCIIAYYLYAGLNQPLNITGLFIIEALFGTYFTSIFAYTFCSKIVSKIGIDIINAGIEKDYVMKKKFFGIRFNMKVLLFVTLPCIFTCIINCAVLIAGYYPFEVSSIIGNGDMQTNRMLNTILINSIVMFLSILFFYNDINAKNTRMTEVLSTITTDFSKITPIETDISDEFSFNHYLANQIISMLRGILFQTEQFGKTIAESSSDLMRIANETESTSVEQSTGIKKIVSTMENATNLSHNIENRIIEVTEIAKQTVEKVNTGSELLSKSLSSISAIADSNEVTIQGIKNLNNKINQIWEIANIIDSISDQTKIIAFNAELEATTEIGESKNFKNVANEIRRLANSTMDSTREIKAKISAVQKSSEQLIKASQESTDLIRKETELSESLENKFTNINNSARYNSTSSNEIKYLVEQQTKAFDQIVNTLHQISTSVQGFSKSTRSLIETSRNLQENVNLIESASISDHNTEENEGMEA
ncbi:methyl-accepting chemotaxis protein [Treponema sp.]|uniref:methyl-accepting chemotaxis protein n=1 Tax=Treponema sp. TaxID=166 RepID=UPI00298D7E8C|nr:methyl-accepting chemotaxis protein [Treponema sp.]